MEKKKERISFLRRSETYTHFHYPGIYVGVKSKTIKPVGLFAPTCTALALINEIIISFNKFFILMLTCSFVAIRVLLF